MEVVKKQPPIPPNSAWATPLIFNDDHPQQQPSQQKSNHPQSSQQQPTSPTTTVTDPTPQPSHRHAELPPPAPTSHRLVRSESAPLNLLDEHTPDLSSLSISPPERLLHPSTTSTFPYNNIPSRRPPAQPSKPPPSRSQSSVSLAEFVNPTIPTGARPPAPAWHKTVFDMIQDDFPRTPSPMLSALLPARPSDRRSRLASTASLDVDLDVLIDPVEELKQDVNRDFGLLQQSLNKKNNIQTRPPKPPSRQHRRSVSVNWAGDLGDFADLRDLNNDVVIPRSQSRNSMAAIGTNTNNNNNVTNSNTATNNNSGNKVSNSASTLFGQSEVCSSQNTNITNVDTNESISPSQSVSPTNSISRSHFVPSPSSHHTNNPQHSMYSTTGTMNHGMTETLLPPNTDELSTSMIQDYDYLYDQTNELTTSANVANPTLTQHQPPPPPPQVNAFNSQPYAAAAAVAAQGVGATPLPLSHTPQQPPNAAASQYAGVFPGIGLFPSPFSTNSNGIALGTNPTNVATTTPVYPDSFRDGLAAADNLKNMSLQMAAFLSAHQQLYAAQMAQMAAMNSGFGTATPFGTTANALHNPNPLAHLATNPNGNVANTNTTNGNNGTSILSNGVSNVTNNAVVGAGNNNGNPGVNINHNARSWDTRDNGNISHRNVSRGKHHFDTIRGNSNGHLNNSKKSGFDANHKGRNSRNRRGHRGHDDLHMISNQKNDRTSSNLPSHLQDSSHSRSPLLEEFRLTSLSIGRSINSVTDIGGMGNPYGSSVADLQNAREWQLSEIKDHVVEFATDQHGSRFIQQKLESASKEDKEAILKHALTDAQHLMMDVFGNYVVQKLLDHGGENAIKAIASELEGRMLVLSLHMYGCRVVQKALEVVEPSSRASLVRELNGHVLKCIRDQNGNHVIQKCVELVEPDSVQFIVDSVQGQAVALAGHSYGCRVVQRILEHGAPHQKAPIMREIMSCIPDLIKDQYGNYVIQHVVEHGTVDERSIIMELVRGEVCQLSQHKFASNVVERCLQFGSFTERQILIEILIVGEGAPNSSPLNHLVRDQFGNYVVQRVLDVAMPSQRERVVSILRAQVPAIKKYSYGKHIIARLEEHSTNQNNYYHSTQHHTGGNHDIGGDGNHHNISGHHRTRSESHIDVTTSNVRTNGHLNLSNNDVHISSSILPVSNAHNLQQTSHEFPYYE